MVSMIAAGYRLNIKNNLPFACDYVRSGKTIRGNNILSVQEDKTLHRFSKHLVSWRSQITLRIKSQQSPY
jgi:hypothetical protein